MLLKWVLPSSDEPDTEQALRLRAAILDETVHALVPALWLYEVGNTIARRFSEHAAGWLSALIKFGLQESPSSQAWLAAALELTRRHRVSFYDAAYHAVALIHRGHFVTADADYIARANSSGSLIPLRDWQPPARTPRRRR